MFIITAACTNGHTQQVKVDEYLGEEYATHFAALLDGTSNMYVNPPPRGPLCEEKMESRHSSRTLHCSEPKDHDGAHRFFEGEQPPMIGRCGICRAPISCTVTQGE